MSTGNLVRDTKKTAARIHHARVTASKMIVRQPQSVPVINIRIPPGRIDSMKPFLTDLPVQCGVTLVISPASLAQQNYLILRSRKMFRMPCSVAIDGMMTKPDAAYIVPVGQEAEVSDGVLRLRKTYKPENASSKHLVTRLDQESLQLRTSMETAFQKIALSAEHQRTEERLRAERDRLMDILDAFVDGVYIANAKLDMEYANPSLKASFGEPQGRKCYSFFRDRDTVCPDCHIEEVFAGNTVQWEWHWKDKAFSMIDTPLQNPDGSISKLGIVRDVTTRNQEQIYERLAAIERLTAHLSSELRNPLATIDSSIYYLRSKLREQDGNIPTHLERIKASVERSVQIVQNLSNLTRLGTGQQQPLDTRKIVADVITEAKLPDGIKTNLNLPDQAVKVNADYTQICLAFRNIVDNAVQAMNGTGELAVSIRAGSQTVEIQFTDTGPGIPAQHLDKIFEPLFTTKAKGVGFGLSISRLVIESHGGTIRAKSPHGAGANLLIRLPLCQA